jgi:hypothetical protein
MEFRLMMRYSDGVGRLLTAHRPRLRAHESVELKAHWIGECPDACGVPLQPVVHCKQSISNRQNS